MSYVNKAGYDITMPPLAPMSLIGDGGGNVQIEAEATAETLNPGEPASAAVTSETAGGVTTLEFAFGIPKGDKGDKGDRGENGQDGAPGAAGAPGAPGQDGVSPVVTVSQNPTTGVITINVVDGSGSHDYTIPEPAPVRMSTNADGSEATPLNRVDVIGTFDSTNNVQVTRNLRLIRPSYDDPEHLVTTEIKTPLNPGKPNAWYVQQDSSTTITLGGLSGSSSRTHSLPLSTFMNQIHYGDSPYSEDCSPFVDKIRTNGGILFLHFLPYKDGTNPTTIRLVFSLTNSAGSNAVSTYSTHYLPKGSVSAPYVFHYLQKNLIDVGGTTYPVPMPSFSVALPIYPKVNPSNCYVAIREELVETYGETTPSLPIEVFGTIVPL